MVHKEDLLEMFITYELEDLYGDFSDDGDGKLELTEKGNEVATTLIKLTEEELSKAREEGKTEVLEQIQRVVEDEALVIARDGTDVVEEYIEEWLSKLKDNK